MEDTILGQGGDPCGLCVSSRRRRASINSMDEKVCYQVLRKSRWPDGKGRCPYCDGTAMARPWPVPYQPACHRYRCRECGRYFNDCTGTVFEGSKLPLGAWFLAIYLVELSTPAAEIARELPCDYHTAYNIAWLVREREIKLEEERRLRGVIEVDEIYQTAGHKGQPRPDNCGAWAVLPVVAGRKRAADVALLPKTPLLSSAW